MEIGGGPVASCSKEQQKIYQQWLAVADSDGDGRITGSDAMKFFAMSNLSRSELKKVWALADTLRLGYLGFSEFISAMQLVSLAQSGHELTPDLLNTAANLEEIKIPEMEGLDALFAKKKAVTTYVPELNGSSQAQSSPTAGWFTAKSKKVPLSAVTSIVEGLKRLYIEKLKPLETTYLFHDFVSPALTNSDFDAKPMVMLLGQYSTGKTTFIKHMLKCEYPGAHIGPEPTTDRFVCVMSGPDERTVPGNTIAVQADMPFSGLSNFGGAFLSKFQCSQMPHPLLEHITFVDTPGLLSGENQRTTQTYDFTGVISWFAAKCDLILLLFDPHKLDISDEFKQVISSLRGHDDKIRVVLNKAGQIDTQQLMREYGALKWSLGKVLNTPEVVRVYIGSFNDKPISDEDIGPMVKELFEREQSDLLADLKDIPKKACDRRINEFVERARAAKIHAYIISHLRKEMPDMMGKSKTQKRLIDNLEDEFAKVQREHHLPAGDFPCIEHFREILNGYSFDKFQKLKPKMIQAVDDMLGYDIPDLLNNFRYPYEGIATAFPPPEPDLSLLLTLALPLPPPPPPSQIKCEVQKEMIFYAYLPLGPSPPDPPSSALLRVPHRGVCGDPFWTVICALHSRAYELASLAEGQAAKERVRAEKYRRELSAKLNFTIYILLGLCGVSLIWAVAEGCGAYKVYKAYQYSREIFYFYKRLYDRSWVRHLVNKLV